MAAVGGGIDQPRPPVGAGHDVAAPEVPVQARGRLGGAGSSGRRPHTSSTARAPAVGERAALARDPRERAQAALGVEARPIGRGSLGSPSEPKRRGAAPSVRHRRWGARQSRRAPAACVSARPRPSSSAPAAFEASGLDPLQHEVVGPDLQHARRAQRAGLGQPAQAAASAAYSTGAASARVLTNARDRRRA